MQKRKKKSSAFALHYDEEYEKFKIGAILRRAREDAGVTQEEIAKKLHTQKSAISRIENHSYDMRLSTLKMYAEALGKKLTLSIS
ncbi:helix-turn-helix transcriptional regulator [candidate division KSB1 bacterium]|nr:helix-turn-helix transcriptional regulator [candidate division KSB1 bacterium]